jgi:hypothetical protein
MDFIASGDSPATWRLEMNYDKDFVFTTTTGLKVVCPAVMGQKANGADEINFHAKGISKQMGISIFGKSCEIQPEQKKVTVSTEGVTYTGCGKYLQKPELHNTWILEQLDDTLLNKKDFGNGLPEVTLNLIDKKMSGYDGCNNIGSDITVQGNRIQFGNIFSTRKFCMGVRSELLRVHLLDHQLVEYYFKDNRLVFYLINDSKLYFRKKY